MKNRVPVTLAVVAFVSIPGVAVAYNQMFLPVTVCNFNDGKFDYDYFNGNSDVMLQNKQTTEESVVCGIGQDQGTSSDDDVHVYYIDLSQVEGHNVQCKDYSVSDTTDTIIQTGYVYGCSQPGGCVTESAFFKSTSSDYLTIPDVRHGGNYVANVVCIVPGVSGGMMSSIISMVLDEF